ncbi:hypothetical protein ACTXT7_001061 [Hymenolepis weldensis]
MNDNGEIACVILLPYPTIVKTITTTATPILLYCCSLCLGLAAKVPNHDNRIEREDHGDESLLEEGQEPREKKIVHICSRFADSGISGRVHGCLYKGTTVLLSKTNNPGTKRLGWSLAHSDASHVLWKAEESECLGRIAERSLTDNKLDRSDSHNLRMLIREENPEKREQNTNKIKVPEWVDVVKLSTANELAPSDPDWFYVRPTGITGLSKVFGRGKRYGVSPRHHVNAYKGILRRCLRELENLGLVDKRADGGREISRAGRRDMDSVAFQTKRALAAMK